MGGRACKKNTVNLSEKDIQAIAQAVAEKVIAAIEGKKLKTEAEEEKESIRRQLEFEAAQPKPQIMKMGGVNK